MLATMPRPVATHPEPDPFDREVMHATHHTPGPLHDFA